MFTEEERWRKENEIKSIVNRGREIKERETHRKIYSIEKDSIE